MHKLTEEFLSDLQSELMKAGVEETLALQHLQEAATHLEESRAALEELDLSENEAAREAVARFGSAKELSRSIVKEIHRIDPTAFNVPTSSALIWATLATCALALDPLAHALATTWTSFVFLFAGMVFVVSLTSRKLQLKSVAASLILCFALLTVILSCAWATPPNLASTILLRSDATSFVQGSSETLGALEKELSEAQSYLAHQTRPIATNQAADAAFLASRPSHFRNLGDTSTPAQYIASLRDSIRSARALRNENQALGSFYGLLWTKALIITALWGTMLLAAHSLGVIVGKALRSLTRLTKDFLIPS